MNLKAKLMVYHTVIDEVSVKYEATREFIKKRFNELCLEHGISGYEVYLYIFMFVMLHTQFGYSHSLERIFFVLKTVLF